GGAAQLPPAGTDPVHELGGVAGSDLPHLDAGAELAGEVANELSEIDPLLGIEQDLHAAPGRLDLHVHDLDPEATGLREAPTRLDARDLPGPALAPFRRLVRGRPAHDPPVGPIALELGQRALGAAHLGDRGRPVQIEDDEVAHVEVGLARQAVLRHHGLAQPNADEIRSALDLALIAHELIAHG